MLVQGGKFATPISGSARHLALDVFVPSGQPNPSWFGAVQMFASCPSAQLNNAYIGQVELTGRPVGSFSTLTYSPGQNVLTALGQQHTDCSFTIAVTVNATPTPLVLDNLRFLP